MNVLVTGIDGFVGSHLADALLKDPDVRLTGITRSRVGQTFLSVPVRPTGMSVPHEKVERIIVDVTNFDPLCEAIRKAAPQKVFHIAGQAFVPTSFENPNETFQSNFQGTLNVLEAVRRTQASGAPPCAVLVVSSGEVYGSVPEGKLPIDENVPFHPENPYAVSKACADMIAHQYRDSFGVDVVVARPFNHFGPRQRDLFVGSAFAKQIAEIKAGVRPPRMMVGNLDPRRDFTDVRDIVDAYIRLLARKQPLPVFNICSERAIPIREILETLIELAGVKVEVVTDPARLRTNENPVVIGSAKRIREATGWEPSIPLRTTLNDLLHYWKERILRPS
jgi:GDP-4-dehydro-6-deoxy-D-mannose reductase